MKFKTVLIAAFLSAVSLSACSAANQTDPALLELARAEPEVAQVQSQSAPPSKLPDAGAYQYKPNTSNPRAVEKAKIHELSKQCIQANNTSAACNEIISLDAAQGKFFIEQETGQRSK